MIILNLNIRFGATCHVYCLIPRSGNLDEEINVEVKGFVKLRKQSKHRVFFQHLVSSKDLILQGPRGGPRRSWDRLGSDPFSSCVSGSLFGPFRGHLGVVLGRLWPHFGPAWALWGPFWVVLGSPGLVFGHSM